MDYQDVAGLEGVKAVLAAAGSNPVYLVGGSVRDLFLGREINDLDMAIPGDLERIARESADKLGVRAVLLGRDPKMVFRLTFQGLVLDLCPLDGPDINTDLLRRDLTINAMALELTPDRSRLIDPLNGARDLRKRSARFVSEENVISDPLRLLRLFRFCSILDLTPDPESLALVRKHAGLISRSAGERIHDELIKLFSPAVCHPVVKSMLEYGLLEALIPELTPLRGCVQGKYHHLDVLGHTMAALESMEKIMAGLDDFFPGRGAEIQEYLDRDLKRVRLKISILMHDLGKPETRSVSSDGEIHFYGHEKAGAEIAVRILARLRSPIAETAYIRKIIENHLRPIRLFEAHRAGSLTPKGVFRFRRDLGPDIPGALIHALADSRASLGPASLARNLNEKHIPFFTDLLDETEQQQKKLEQSPRFLSGTDIMREFNLRPSPLLRVLLDAVEEGRALGTVANRDEALKLVEKLVKKDGTAD